MWPFESKGDRVRRSQSGAAVNGNAQAVRQEWRKTISGVHVFSPSPVLSMRIPTPRFNYSICAPRRYLLFSGESARVSNTLRSQESRSVAKKNASVYLSVGGGPPKTRYALRVHHLSLPVLLFQHS